MIDHRYIFNPNLFYILSIFVTNAINAYYRYQ